MSELSYPVETGMAVAEICRKGGFSDATLYKWRAQFGDVAVSETAVTCPGSSDH